MFLLGYQNIVQLRRATPSFQAHFLIQYKFLLTWKEFYGESLSRPFLSE
jgi:hypothetical protein